MFQSMECAAVDQGHACRLDAAMLEPVPLCVEHRLQVALLVVPDVLADAIRLLASGQTPKTLPEGERDALVAGARALDVRPYLAGGMHGPIVYFIDNGDRVKIGYTTNLRSRIQAFALQDKNVLMILQGGLTLERALHAVFASDRIDSTEWFTKSDAICAYITSKLADRDSVAQRQAQRQQRKHAVAHGPTGSAPQPLRRSQHDWAALAAPLYRQFIKDHEGAKPSAPELVALLRDAHPTLRIPTSERSERNIRSATEALIKASRAAGDNGKNHPVPETADEMAR